MIDLKEKLDNEDNQHIRRVLEVGDIQLDFNIKIETHKCIVYEHINDGISLKNFLTNYALKLDEDVAKFYA